MHLKAQDSLCTPKSSGGPGFRRMYDHNHALISKHAWTVTQKNIKPHAMLLKFRYLHITPIMHCKAPNNSSFFCKGLCKTIEIICKGSCWNIGSGNLVNIWIDPWVPQNPNHKPVLNEAYLHTQGSLTWIYELIDFENMCWKIDLL